MNRLLITGARGQLGSDCCEVFRDKYETAAVDLPEVDLSSREACREVLEHYQPDVVLNCAASTDVDGCEGNEGNCWPINAEEPGFLADWAARNQRYLIHVSTDFVFDGRREMPGAYLEQDEPGPLSAYGRSKRAGEEAVLRAGADSAIVRTAWLYGKRGRNFPKTMLRLSLSGPEQAIKVVNDQFGSPTWSHDLARQIEKIISSRATGIFHASSEGYCSWYEFACRFLDEMDVSHHLVPCTTPDYPTPAKRPVNSILENKRLRDANMNVMRDWRTGLKEFVFRHRAELLNEMEGVGE